MNERRDLEAALTSAAALASAGDWPGVYAELAPVDADEVASSAIVAYRFGEALYYTGRMRELAAYASRYVASSRETADTDGLLRALNLAGIAAFELGEITSAESSWDEQMGLADGAGDHDMLARAANNLGAIANLRGASNEAITLYRLAVPAYQRLGQDRGLAQTYHNIGVSYRDLGRVDDALSAFARARAVAERIPYPPIIVMTLVSRAELEIRRGEHAVASELARRALRLARELDDPVNEAGALRVWGLSQARGGDRAGGREELDAALALARSSGNTLLEAEALRDIALAASRHEDEETESLRAAIEAFERLGASAETKRLRRRLGAR
ncbi:MAG: tetratricopeptide repeat protein [Gemmatimonadetes bacterium]|nr:tetratricopeptide repeat protein [Gemmatimonadota bacterium]